MQITVRGLLIWQNSTMHLYVSQITCHFCRSERLFVSSNKFIDLLSIFWNFQYCSTLLNNSRIFSGLCAWSNIFLQVRIFYNESQCYTNISAKLLKKISTQFTKIHDNTSVIFHRSLSIISIRKRKRKRRVYTNDNVRWYAEKQSIDFQTSLICNWSLAGSAKQWVEIQTGSDIMRVKVWLDRISIEWSGVNILDWIEYPTSWSLIW